MDCCCDPLTLTTSINTLAVALAQNLSEEELLLLAAILEQMNRTLITIAAQRDLCASLRKSKT